MTSYRNELMALMKRDDLGNKTCVDCAAPNPQWATIPYAVFICLSCAGLHRGLGVHISFVRSITMDEWTEEQMKKMRIGGNLPFTTFMKDYTPADQGGYREGMSVQEKYNTWAAAQYKEKLSAEVAGQEWSPSAPPSNFGQNISRPSSAQGVRKSRTANRGISSLRQDSSPAPGLSSSSSFNEAAYERRTANETYFEGLGAANANRRDDLPPSQGGKYQGFGSTPTPASNNPSWGTSSAAVPTLEEFQTQPVAALSKGWSLLSAAVTLAGKAVAEKAMDPSLHDNVRSYASTASTYAAQAGKVALDTGRTANEWSKNQLGVDVADTVVGVADKAKGALGISNHPGGGYESVGGGYSGWHDEDGTRLYADGDDDDFFDTHGGSAPITPATPGTAGTANSQASGDVAPLTTKAKDKPKADFDAEWQDW